MEQKQQDDGWVACHWPLENRDRDVLETVFDEVCKLGNVDEDERPASREALYQHEAVKALEARLHEIGEQKIRRYLKEILPTCSAVAFLNWQDDLLDSSGGVDAGGFLVVEDGVPYAIARLRLEPLEGMPRMDGRHWWYERIIKGAFVFRRRIKSCGEQTVDGLSRRGAANVRRSGLDPFRHVRFDEEAPWEVRTEFVSGFVYEELCECGIWPEEVYLPAASEWRKLSGEAARVAQTLAGLAWNPLVFKDKED